MKSCASLILILAALTISDAADLECVALPYTFQYSDVILYLYTQANLNNPVVISMNESLSTPYFNASKEIVLIIHGWNDSYLSDVNTIITAAILTNFDVNIFVVDWSKVGTTSNYDQAVAGVQPIALALAQYFNTVMGNYSIQATNIKMFGHSLGAHMAGIMGSALNGQAKYIVGMDPAGPCYYITNAAGRINSTSAKMVQIIHTNAGTYGIVFSCGVADYWPNGGIEQPGCGMKSDPTNCSHEMSYKLVGESILKGAGFTATKCTRTNMLNVCTNEVTSFLGRFEIDYSAIGNYTLMTNAESPYSKK